MQFEINKRFWRAWDREKIEIGERYGIVWGQTTIYCRECKRVVVDPLGHRFTCLGVKSRPEASW